MSLPRSALGAPFHAPIADQDVHGCQPCEHGWLRSNAWVEVHLRYTDSEQAKMSLLAVVPVAATMPYNDPIETFHPAPVSGRRWEQTMHAALKIDEPALARFCTRHGIRRLSLFGSQLNGRSGPSSDIDLLVEFETGREPGLLGLAEMEAELATMLGGQPVDLRTAQDLSRYFREEVSRTAEVQYAR